MARIIVFNFLILVVLLGSCATGDIIEEQTEFFYKHKADFNKFVSIFKEYDIHYSLSIEHHANRNANGHQMWIVAPHCNYMNDSFPRLDAYTKYHDVRYIDYIHSLGLIDFGTDYVPNIHRQETSIIYSMICEDSLKSKFSNWEFVENGEIPQNSECWFYHIEDNWYILSPNSIGQGVLDRFSNDIE